MVSLPDTIVWLANSYVTLNASLGAVEALIASGRLALIEDATVRSSLAGLREKVVDAVEEQLRAERLYSDFILPLTAAEPRWPDGYKIIDVEFWELPRVPGRQLPAHGSVEVPVRGDYSAFLWERLLEYRVSVGEMRGLLAALDSLHVKLEPGERPDPS